MLKTFVMQCYQAWIQQNIPYGEEAGNCTIWSRVMAQAFPELIHVGGYVRKKKNPDPEDMFYDIGFSFFNSNYHEYLITEEGEIVDPTALQFDILIGKGKWEYDRCEEHLIYGGADAKL